MCGIFFCLDKKNLNISKCIECLNLLKKRGPDFIHYDTINNMFLGQTILSIVGEYKKSNFNSNNHLILFNGEIYNYKKIDKSNNSDTNILVNLFDNKSFEEIINLIDGMYCFVCWNKNNNI
jgi:asparagine synthetase B (glutamine-hydrolysing)